MRSSRLVMTVVAAALAVTACGSTDGTPAPTATPVASTTPAPVASSAVVTTTPAAAIPEQLQFLATTLDAAPFDGSSLAGKDAVLWFWAPWCGECRREAPHVAAVQSATKNEVAFVGVAGLGPIADMKSFVETYDVGAFPHIADADGAVWKRFGVIQQPAYAFIDDSGAVTVVRGELGEQGLTDRVADLRAN